MRQSLRHIPTVFVMAALLAAGGVSGAVAQDSTSDSACVGTWLLQVTPIDQPASAGFPVSAIFGADGSFVVTGYPVRPAHRMRPRLPTPSVRAWASGRRRTRAPVR